MYRVALYHTQWHTHTFSRIPLDEGSARRRDFYLTTHNIHKRKTSMSPAGFEPEIPASERPQTHALDRAANGIGSKAVKLTNKYVYFVPHIRHSHSLAQLFTIFIGNTSLAFITEHMVTGSKYWKEVKDLYILMKKDSRIYAWCLVATLVKDTGSPSNCQSKFWLPWALIMMVLATFSHLQTAHSYA